MLAILHHVKTVDCVTEKMEETSHVHVLQVGVDLHNSLVSKYDMFFVTGPSPAEKFTLVLEYSYKVLWFQNKLQNAKREQGMIRLINQPGPGKIC